MPTVINPPSTIVQGVMITKDDVLRAMEQFDAKLRATYPSRLWKKYAVKYNDKIYPPKDLLRLATGLTKIPHGGEEVSNKFQFLRSMNVATLHRVA